MVEHANKVTVAYFEERTQFYQSQEPLTPEKLKVLLPRKVTYKEAGLQPGNISGLQTKQHSELTKPSPNDLNLGKKRTKD